jgi:hypothetical protein
MEPSLFGISGLPGVDNDTQVMDEWTFCSILGKTRCAEVRQFIVVRMPISADFFRDRFSKNTGIPGLRKMTLSGWPTMG